MVNNPANKKKTVQTDSTGKVITNYDKKVLKRKQEELKKKRNALIAKICGIVLIIAMVAGVASYFIVKHNKAYGEYITVGSEKVSGIEFDFYYNVSANNFIKQYSSYLSYIGLDTTKSYDSQNYSADLTWADYFKQGAAQTLQQTKAITADIKTTGFNYDVTSDYNTYIESIKKGASDASMSLKAYYKKMFGDNATESNLEDIMKEYLAASAYYSSLTEKNTPSDSDIKAYYESNKDTYDSLNYRVMELDTQAKANEMVSKITDETSFATLCKTYASDSNKSKYETGDASLVEGAKSSSISSAYSKWLYDSTRKFGDVTVIEDTDSGVYGVLYFVSRYYDSATDSTISSTIASQKVSEYVDGLIKSFEITDKKAHLKYLTLSTTAAE